MRGHVTDIQRARMLAAMTELCAERGAHNVTVAHVVERSGVSRRTFYEQFTDRDDCMLAALDEALACAGRRVLPCYEAAGRWRERIRASLIALLSFIEEEPFMGRLLVVETLSAGERALPRRQEVLSRVVAAVEEGRGEARKGGASLSALTAEGGVGGVLAVLHARLVDTRPGWLRGETQAGSMLGLTGQLMSMVVLPYLGPAAAQKELSRPAPAYAGGGRSAPANPLRDLDMRLTYRTIRMLLAVAAHPGASNRELGAVSDINDQGQISKLLTRLHRLGLIANGGAGHARGGPNAWTLTDSGLAVEQALAQQTGVLNGR